MNKIYTSPYSRLCSRILACHLVFLFQALRIFCYLAHTDYWLHLFFFFFLLLFYLSHCMCECVKIIFASRFLCCTNGINWIVGGHSFHLDSPLCLFHWKSRWSKYFVRSTWNSSWRLCLWLCRTLQHTSRALLWGGLWAIALWLLF